MILLPAIDIRDGRCVRLVQGDYAKETVYDEEPVAVAKRYEAEGAEWLHVVDLDAALKGEPRNRAVVDEVIRSVGIPVQTSGGIRSADAIAWARAAGAARVVLGTQALLDPPFVERAVANAGDMIAVGLDVRGKRLQARGWTEDAGDLNETLSRLDAAGVKRYVVTDVAKDGMLQGPNVDLLRAVMMETSARVVASGGVSSLDDLRDLAAIGVEACIIGKALYAGAFSLPEALHVSREGSDNGGR
ncbi:MAG TPA: 1-(5-phosphoribosyl)-5-[(5-phosphoribosylamino)methylideneamino]imidazole-4-carboxamide isomerase [Actinomycetota bacterium]|nr:1-(5-phosphoribosyl)-5-[(5-phosphoribosylamino)methylideneamino]imidazole-4-carboxamide isomerase [Actinomycetota bacterium]